MKPQPVLRMSEYRSPWPCPFRLYLYRWRKYGSSHPILVASRVARWRPAALLTTTPIFWNLSRTALRTPKMAPVSVTSAVKLRTTVDWPPARSTPVISVSVNCRVALFRPISQAKSRSLAPTSCVSVQIWYYYGRSCLQERRKAVQNPAEHDGDIVASLVDALRASDREQSLCKFRLPPFLNSSRRMKIHLQSLCLCRTCYC